MHRYDREFKIGNEVISASNILHTHLVWQAIKATRMESPTKADNVRFIFIDDSIPKNYQA